MRKSQKTNQKKEVALVHCCDCKNFKRDTEGRSFCLDTGEFFMGVCLAVCKENSRVKKFADKPRICPLFECISSENSTK